MSNRIINCNTQIEQVFNGELSEVHHQCKAMFQNRVYQAACLVLSHKSVDARRFELDRLHPSIKETVQAEVKRLFEYRKAQGKPTNQKC